MKAQRGFTYLGVLLSIALIGIGLAAASELWSMTARRQRLEQLDWVGAQFVQAIGSYYEGSPHGAKAFPRQLSDLLEDRRIGFRRRHLRQIYADPFSGAAQWNLVTAPDGGIRGVSARVPDIEGGKTIVREFVYVPATVR